MSTQLIITLCILAFLVVMLLTHKLPYGVSAMICCVLFVFFGILDLKTAFSLCLYARIHYLCSRYA